MPRVPTPSRLFACERLELRRLLAATSSTAAPSAATASAAIASSGAQASADLPRYLTSAEQQYLLDHPGYFNTGLGIVPSSPPTGPIEPVAEYEPMEGLVISWMTYTSILGQISKRVTDAGGRMYIGVTSASVQSSATSTLNGLGVNMANVTFFTVPLNSVWARDYGPRYVYEGNVRVITDHQYNRPRPLDDNEPVVFSSFHQQQIYQLGLNGTNLIHGGGNFHLDASGDAYATALVTTENPSFTAQQVQQIWNTYEADDVTITGRFPTSVDSTGHIDMWMQIYDDHKVFISDWPNNPGSAQDVICDNTAALMASRGYSVTRLPAYSIGGTHYTFANMVIFNDIVLLPQYNNGPGATVSSQTLAAVQAAMPDKTVFGINADQIITAAGAFHCIVQHVPIEKGLPGPNGGLAPVAYLRGPNNGQTLVAGQGYQIEWITDDDAPVAASSGVQSVDILLSTNGGRSFDITVATNQPALGAFNWTVPAGINTALARLRIVARDGDGNTGFDDTDTTFTIHTPLPNGVWTGGGDGTNWSDAANWSNNAVPTIADDVIIDTPGTFTVNLDATTTRVHSITLGNAAGSSPTLSMNPAGEHVLITGALAVNGTSKLDLNDNNLIVDYAAGSSSPLAAIANLIATARAGGDWTGSGITSAAAANPAHNTTLGILESTDYATVHGGPFAGQSLDDSAVLVKYTYYGDTDFNGAVNFDDYVRTDNGFNNHLSGWLNGDFDGNGAVNFDDYVLIDSAFNTQGGVLRHTRNTA